MNGSINRRYKIVGRLGAGGMGEVFRVLDLRDGQERALKVLDPTLAPPTDAALAEFSLLARLAHPSLVSVYDCGVASSAPKALLGRLFFTMELLEGHSLAATPSRRISSDWLREVASETLLGLAAIHAAGIIHRDVKAENIFIEDGGRIRLLDFGLAAVEARVRSAEGLSGSVGYWAPEILRGAACDVRSDLFSLGVTLYRSLSGRFPDPHHLIGIRDQRPDCDPELASCIEWLLASEPRERPASAAGALASLGIRLGELSSALPEFCGRSPLMSELVADLANDKPGPHLTWISGEAGIGKTRLLEELAVSLRLQGAFVGELQPGRGAYSAIREAFNGLARRRPPVGVNLRRDLDLIAGGPLSEELNDELESGDARLAFLDRIARYLLTAAAAQPLVFIGDDASEIDGASREVLRYLLRSARLAKATIRVVLTGQSAEPAIAGAPDRSHELAPLEAAEAEAIARSLGRERSEAQDLAKRSGGHPATLLAIAGKDGGLALASSFEGLLAESTPSERAVLLCLAVIQRPARLDELLAFLPRRPRDDTAEAVGALLASQRLRRTGLPARYSLRPPVLARWLLESCHEPERRATQAGIFEALTAAGSPGEERARLALDLGLPEAGALALQAGRYCLAIHDVDRARQLLNAAGEQLKGTARGEARCLLAELQLRCGELGKAIEVLEGIAQANPQVTPNSGAEEPGSTMSVMQARIAARLVEALRARGQPSAAWAAAERGIAALGADSRREARRARAELLRLQARLAGVRGDHQESERRCLAARAALSKPDAAGQRGFWIDIEQAINRILRREPGDDEAAEALLNTAAAGLKTLGDRRGQSEASRSLGLLAFHRDDGEAAESHYREALEHLRDEGPASLGVLNNLAMIAQRWGDPRVAEARMKDCLGAAERMGALHLVCRVTTNLGRLRRLQGDAGGAIRAFQKAVEAAQQAKDPIIESAAWSELGASLLELGRLRRSLEAYQASRRLRAGLADLSRFGISEEELARYWDRAGDVEAALDHGWTALALAAGRRAEGETAQRIDFLMALGRRPGGSAALLRAIRRDAPPRELPDGAQEIAEAGRANADIGLLLAAGIASREAGDRRLSRRLAERALLASDALKVMPGPMRCFARALMQEDRLAALAQLNLLDDAAPPIVARARLLSAEWRIEEGDPVGAARVARELLAQDPSPANAVAARRVLAKARVLAPQADLGKAGEPSPRAIFAQCIGEARASGDLLSLARAASELAGLEAARRNIAGAEAALASAREAAAQLAAELPTELREDWQRRLATPSTSVASIASSRERLLPMIEQVLASDLRLEPLLELVISLLVEATGAERGFLILRGSHGGLSLRSAHNIATEELKSEGFRGSQSIVEKVSESGEPILVSDAASDLRFAGRGSVLSQRIRSVLAAPIERAETILGVVYLDHQRAVGCFGDDELDLVLGFTRQLATTLQHSRDQAAAVAEAQREASRLRELAALARGVKSRYRLLGQSAPMTRLQGLIERYAKASVPVLILGESGTGKEIAARSLHSLSPRADQPFVAINCAGMPETLLDAELFGYRRGAFSGADADRAGIFENADGGTLFLDEIGDMGGAMQRKLLRVLASSEVRRIGEAHARPVQVRLLAATHRDLSEMVSEGSFREDLYFRLNVLRVLLPALRERREDIPLLAAHFLREADPARELRLSPAALRALMGFGFRGNVRELRNVILRAATLCGEELIGIDHLLLEDMASPSKRPLSPDYHKVHEIDGVALNRRQKLVLVRLRGGSGWTTTKEHSGDHEISERTSLRDLRELVNLGLLVRRGSRKSARYGLADMP